MPSIEKHAEISMQRTTKPKVSKTVLFESIFLTEI